MVFLFRVLVRKPFDEYRDTGFELICVDLKDTFVFNLGVEVLLVLKEVE